MDINIEKCMVDLRHLSAPQIKKMLQYKDLLTYVLLDLRLLEKAVNNSGQEKITSANLSREERGQLSKFASAKRKKEWIGGRFAAKYATARLLEKTKSQDNTMAWSGHNILADKNGRPFLAVNQENPENSVDISISHSASIAAAMAVNKGYCGIDIQKITPQVIKVSDRFCTSSETKVLHAFFSVDDKISATPLTKLWAAKEALRKAFSMNSIPGFLELELIEITSVPLQKDSDLWGFIFKWRNSAGSIHKICRVAVAHIAGYALALTARNDTVN
jgi:phosphopantetheinyl transferase (holo-ACP synthase)